MTDHYVTRHVPDGSDLDYRIDELAGVYSPLDSSQVFQMPQWRHSIDQVIMNIRAGHRYIVIKHGRSVHCYIKQHPLTGRWFVTTSADGFMPNNLAQQH